MGTPHGLVWLLVDVYSCRHLSMYVCVSMFLNFIRFPRLYGTGWALRPHICICPHVHVTVSLCPGMNAHTNLPPSQGAGPGLHNPRPQGRRGS